MRFGPCKRLIANAIICWNYLYVSKQMSLARTDEERNEILNAVKNGSMVIYQHVNFHGEYDFSDKALENAEIFDLDVLMALEAWMDKNGNTFSV